MVRCICDCGNEITTQLYLVTSGKTKSCGCYRKENSRLIHRKFFNDYEIIGENVKVYDDNHSNFFWIDLDDLALISNHHWNRTALQDGSTYWETTINKNKQRLHYLLTGKWSDHIDGDTDNNRRSNLRRCTPMQNAWNTSKQRDGKIPYKGVYLKREKYVARIYNDGIAYNLGSYNTPEEAAVVYDIKALSLRGEWARLNFPERKDEYLACIGGFQ